MFLSITDYLEQFRGDHLYEQQWIPPPSGFNTDEEMRNAYIRSTARERSERLDREAYSYGRWQFPSIDEEDVEKIRKTWDARLAFATINGEPPDIEVTKPDVPALPPPPKDGEIISPDALDGYCEIVPMNEEYWDMLKNRLLKSKDDEDSE